MKKISSTSCKVALTTDYGTIRVKSPTKVMGPKSTNNNMRYKVSKNLSYNEKDVLEANNPEKINVTKSNLSSSYIFAKEDKFFVYPNNYNHLPKCIMTLFNMEESHFREEMLIPYVFLANK